MFFDTLVTIGICIYFYYCSIVFSSKNNFYYIKQLINYLIKWIHYQYWKMFVSAQLVFSYY